MPTTTREEILSYLKKYMRLFETMTTPEERAGTMMDIFLYLLRNFSDVELHFANDTQFIKTIGKKCEEMVLVKRFPHLVTVANRLLNRVNESNKC